MEPNPVEPQSEGAARTREAGLRHMALAIVLAGIGLYLAIGGLPFIRATPDRIFRAFYSTDGRMLSQWLLPAGAHATPMTYLSPRSGRQFVVVAAGGSARLGSGSGDAVIAFALPQRR